MKLVSFFSAAIVSTALLSACGSSDGSIDQQPTNEFVEKLRAHCGSAFAGKLVSTDPQDEDFKTASITVEVQCSRDAVLMPLHVGDDHSRAWRLTRIDDAAQLKLTHWHIHDDGSEDAISRYGGAATGVATSIRQEFPADDATKRIFDAQNISVSNQNTWAFDIDEEANTFAYEMSRPNRFFRIEFDTSTAVWPPEDVWWGTGMDFENTF